ncbi:PAS domain-containing protein [Aquabacterium sp.]|uniref:PAS domain-containing protein n=1 Tax=Aquabacterium sp. TaxID=1872578 RepID=UPI002CAB801E|nr:PAS domain-containing protein [Aquabacterium sp.]HSW07726.1 PAS domain-containing protein [Aquabacterium sp.]
MPSNLEHPLPPAHPHIQSGTALILIVDADRRIRHINLALSQLMGYAGAQLIGHPFPLLRHPDMPASAMREMWAQVDAGAPWIATLALRRRDGNRLWALATCAPVRHPRLGACVMIVLMRPSDAQLHAALTSYEHQHNRISIWLDKLMLEPLALDDVTRW